MGVLSAPIKGDSFRRTGAQFEALRVSAQDAPNMTVKVNAGAFQLPSSEIVEYAGGNSAAFTAPSSNARWTAVCLTTAGALTLVNGTASTAPTQPTIPVNALLLALVYVQAGTTVITNDMVFDARPLFRTASADHSTLTNLSAANAHPISAITGLQAALDAKVAISDNVNELAGKSDIDGTTNETFVLNKDYTGVPSANCAIVVERGSSANVEIRWNETTDTFEFTNDGLNYQSLGGVDQIDEIDDLITLSGVAANAENLGAFTGNAISDNGTIKAALQELATAVDLNTAKNSYPTGDATKVGHITVTQAVNLDTMETALTAKFNAEGGNTVYANLVAVQAVYTTPADGDFVLVRGQGAAFYDASVSPAMWVKASDGITPIV